MKGLKKVIALTLAATLIYSSVGQVKAYSLLNENEIVANEEVTDVKDFKYDVLEDKITITGYEGDDEKIIIPEKINDMKVVAIKEEAFKECKLKEIAMPFIESLDERAFIDSSLLEKIEISNKVIVKDDTFKGTNINTVTINYHDEDISKITMEDFNEIVSKLHGIDVSKITEKLVVNKEYKKNLDDITGPVITLKGDEVLKLSVGSVYGEPGATAYDEFEKVEVPVKVEGIVDSTKIGEYTITYTAIDSSRNISNVKRVVKIVDEEAPIIKLNGAAEITIEAGQRYEELGAIGVDSVDGNIKATVESLVNTSKPGVYILTYVVTDSSGNSAQATRKVTVIDTTAPEITLSGQKEITIEGGNKYEDAGATASDIVNGKVDVKVSGEVDTKKVGEYNVTYTAIDAAGNKSTVVRKVKVVDTTRPIIIFNGDKEITLEAKSKYTEQGAIGKDIIDGKVDVTIIADVDTNKVGEYLVSYYAKDKAGNKASAVRKVYVKDTVAPIITLNGDSKVKLEVGDRYVEENAEAKDGVDGQLAVVIDGKVDTSKVGEYTVKYTATDNSKNTSSVTRTIQVEEKKIVDDKVDNTDKDNNNNNNQIVIEKDNNTFYIVIGIIGGILAVIGLTALGFTYYKKNKK